MEWYPLLAILPALRACYDLFMPILAFIPPTVSSLYPGSSMWQPRARITWNLTWGSQACSLLLPLCFMALYPIRGDHTGDFLRLTATPKNPPRSMTRSESQSFCCSQPFPRSFYQGPPGPGLRTGEKSPGHRWFPCLPASFAFFVRTLRLRAASFPLLYSPSRWCGVNLFRAYSTRPGSGYTNGS